MTLVATVAGAQPAGDPGFLPIEVATGSPTGTVVVEPGDHLWKISARHLEAIGGSTPTAEQVTPYWREVIEANRDRLRSGDPDLIYPGEVVVLPDAD